MQYSEMKQILLTLTDPADKLDAVIEFGHQIPAVPHTALCTEISGCASRAEICRDGNNFYGRADSELVRGIIAILTAMVDGKSPDDIKKMNLEHEFMSLNLALGIGRLGGVNSMIRFLQNL